jgi:hypothetical protein
MGVQAEIRHRAKAEIRRMAWQLTYKYGVAPG